jgi:hypothetical protein
VAVVAGHRGEIDVEGQQDSPERDAGGVVEVFPTRLKSPSQADRRDRARAERDELPCKCRAPRIGALRERGSDTLSGVSATPYEKQDELCYPMAHLGCEISPRSPCSTGSSMRMRAPFKRP